MATLYELNEQLRDFELEIDEETGEILNADMLDALEIERKDKIENIALWIKNLRSDAEAYKKEKESFNKKEAAAKNKADRLKDYLSEMIKGERFKSDKVEISWRRSEAVNVDMDMIPAEYVIEQAPKPDKTKIRQDLKNGILIPGATLEERENIQIK